MINRLATLDLTLDTKITIIQLNAMAMTSIFHATFKGSLKARACREIFIIHRGKRKTSILDITENTIILNSWDYPTDFLGMGNAIVNLYRPLLDEEILYLNVKYPMFICKIEVKESNSFEVRESCFTGKVQLPETLEVKDIADIDFTGHAVIDREHINAQKRIIAEQATLVKGLRL